MVLKLQNSGDPMVAPGHTFSPGPPLSSVLPDIVLPDQHGRIVDLHAHRSGRRAWVLFHRSADW
ncbi:MAG: hypothetical protein HY332_04640 [Chloroflexi bacterium]|nr:hypothetical protein [Chloroflexota bacterium]